MKQFDTICTDFEKYCDFIEDTNKSKSNFFGNFLYQNKNYIVITKLFLNTLENFLTNNNLKLTKTELLTLLFFKLPFSRIDHISAARETDISVEYLIDEHKYALKLTSNNIKDLNERLEFIIENINRIFNLKVTYTYLIDFLFKTNGDNVCIRNLSMDTLNNLHMDFFTSLSLNRLFKLIDKNLLLSKILLIKWDFENEQNLAVNIRKFSFFPHYFPCLLSVNYRIYKNINRVDHFIHIQKPVIEFDPLNVHSNIHISSQLFKIDGYIHKYYNELSVLIDRQLYPGSSLSHSNRIFETTTYYILPKIVLSESKGYIIHTLELCIEFYDLMYRLEEYPEGSCFKPVKCFLTINHLQNIVATLKSEEFKRIVYEQEYGK